MRMSIRCCPPMRWCIGGQYYFLGKSGGGFCLNRRADYRDIQLSNFCITAATGRHVAAKYQASGTKQNRKRFAE